ncbi:ribosome biogenesis GTP-binding protein YihA/YsxC [Fructobacillus sp. W13]|uniref:Probable GTP-binding protein EngB n=1 Tax=Fructobacillus apis TaxID=2935017 RepID=A0ABT0ZQI4_9LACO|nr:ribosome biogenesis GTP-binding protein YihA/YsxC [Fructobacillus apis]MCO0832240.1 ribosome biogenesis GTP-binding protein YihA/YsxC [Fructobacillus apis]
MDVHNVEMVMSAVSPSQYPEDGRPEFALVGRSNVGKSSLTNTLINRKNFARTSGQPGKTQTLNFYAVEDTLYFVDVPGYGYAKVSKKKREEFGQMIETYITSRKQLRGVISLVDARHKPSEEDIMMYQWLDYYNIPVLLVATKSDKIACGKLNQSESVIKKAVEFNPENSDFCFFSSVNKSGKDTVWDWIESKMTEY